MIEEYAEVEQSGTYGKPVSEVYASLEAELREHGYTMRPDSVRITVRTEYVGRDAIYSPWRGLGVGEHKIITATASGRRDSINTKGEA